uniref:Nucleolar protein 11 n=1 Tax=Leptobrachium leishanense TaxID=445787 RepID=A0A8C5R6R3_9ANUR
MAAFREEFTLIGVLTGTVCVGGRPEGLKGVESGGEADTVVVTDAGRAVTLYKVSDQKPLGSWTVKQGQVITAPAVYNHGAGEYITVHDDKVIRIWKDSDVNLEKVFKATLSAAVCRIHSLPDCEPVVLFRGGSVQFLDTVLTDPLQEVETVLQDGEGILWSDMYTEGDQSVLVYITQKVSHYLYIWSSNPVVTQKYTLSPCSAGSCVLSFSGSLRNKTYSLTILYASGRVCQGLVSLVRCATEEALAMTPLLQLAEPSENGAVAILDESHIVTLTTSRSKQKDTLSIWNTKFQTVQATKELPLKTSMQLWCHEHKIYVVHGKAVMVVPYFCEPSCLASALGKGRDLQTAGLETVSFANWDALVGNVPNVAEVKKSSSGSRKTHAPENQIPSIVQAALRGHEAVDFHLTIGKVTLGLLNRCQRDPRFYPQSSLTQLIQTTLLSYSSCPDLVTLALEKQDVCLLQLCIQCLPDLPESVICSCLKAFLSVGEDLLRDAPLSTEHVEDYIDVTENPEQASEPSAPDAAVTQNGFSPVALEDDSCDIRTPEPQQQRNAPPTSPVSLKRAVLLNTVLTCPYSETFLLPHLKTLSIGFYWFLYVCLSFLLYAVLDAHFTVVVMLPEAKKLLYKIHKFVKNQVKFYSELNKVEGSLTEIHRMKHQARDSDTYSIEVLELY